MTAPSTPVSEVLEAELRLKVRARGLVVWLDKERAYSAFVDRHVVAPVEDLRMVAFRGSHLEMMLALESLTSGTDLPRLVVHVPGVSAAEVARTPLFELTQFGVELTKRLDTLVTEAATGRARAELVASFLAGKPTLEQADAWLAEQIEASSAGIRAQLRAMSLTAVVDDLIDRERGFVAKKIREGDAADRRAVLDQLDAWTGLTPAWRAETMNDERVEDLLFSVASFALAVEYVRDLKRAPQQALLLPLARLAQPHVDACRTLAQHLRERHAELYERLADATEAALDVEVASAVAADLGRIDTFRFEEDRVLSHALDALKLGDWPAAVADAETRAEASGGVESIWTRKPERRAAWLLVRDAARLGLAVREAPVPAASTLPELVTAYVSRGAAVDRAHRLLEQRRAAALFPEVPYFERVRQQLDRMRDVWVEWGDAWARAMSRVCRERGFLPPRALLQRSVFEDVVLPLVRDAVDKKSGADRPTAVFVVDALRYEMGEELFQEMAATPATEAHLRAALAELPTVTSVGMNALAPTAAPAQAGGVPALRPVMSANERRIEGFTTGELRVLGPAERFRVMHERAGGATRVTWRLDEVVAAESGSLARKVAEARLVIVHSLELDEAGESGVGPIVFEQVLQKLRAAWRLLREAGVKRFVVTADHGFLLLDGLQRAPETQGRRIDPDRRHVLTRNAANEEGRVRVALADLGYVGAEGMHLVLSETTNVFDRGARGGGFVHGGNSLQERVVPVITLVHRVTAGASAGRYVVRAEARPGIAGMHCVRASVEVEENAQMSLAFARAATIELVLRVAGGEGTIEIVQTRDGAELVGSAVRASVGRTFEVFFRVTRAREERVQVEVAHAGGEQDVEAATLADWFEATVAVEPPAPKAPAAAATPDARAWLEAMPEDLRRIYEHLGVHGSITEDEVGSMLGSGARGARRFGRHLDEHQARLPFAVRIEAIDGVKRWMREGRVA